MDAEVVILMVGMVLLTLLFVDLYTAKHSTDWARKAQGRQDRQAWEERLILKDGETVVGVIERGQGTYAFITLDVPKSPRVEDY